MRSIFLASAVLSLVAPTIGSAQLAYYMFNTGSSAIGVADLDTGVTSLLTSNSIGSGPVLTGTYCIELEDEDSLLVFGPKQPSDGHWLVRVDRATGDRTVVSSDSTTTPVGTGPGFAPVGLGTFDLEMLPGGTEVLLVDYAVGLMKIDLTNGNRSYITSVGTTPVGSGPYTLFTDVILEPSGDIIAFDILSGFVRVDGITGNRTDMGLTEPVDLEYPMGERGEDAVYYWNSSTNELRLFNLTTQADTVVSSASVGTGPNFPNFFPLIDFVYVDGRLFVLTLEAIFEVDPTNGNRTLFTPSSGPPIAPNPNSATFDMALDPNGSTAVADWFVY